MASRQPSDTNNCTSHTSMPGVQVLNLDRSRRTLSRTGDAEATAALHPDRERYNEERARTQSLNALRHASRDLRVGVRGYYFPEGHDRTVADRQRYRSMPEPRLSCGVPSLPSSRAGRAERVVASRGILPTDKVLSTEEMARIMHAPSPSVAESSALNSTLYNRNFADTNVAIRSSIARAHAERLDRVAPLTLAQVVIGNTGMFQVPYSFRARTVQSPSGAVMWEPLDVIRGVCRNNTNRQECFAEAALALRLIDRSTATTLALLYPNALPRCQIFNYGRLVFGEGAQARNVSMAAIVDGLMPTHATPLLYLRFGGTGHVVIIGKDANGTPYWVDPTGGPRGATVVHVGMQAMEAQATREGGLSHLFAFGVEIASRRSDDGGGLGTGAYMNTEEAASYYRRRRSNVRMGGRPAHRRCRRPSAAAAAAAADDDDDDDVVGRLSQQFRRLSFRDVAAPAPAAAAVRRRRPYRRFRVRNMPGSRNATGSGRSPNPFFAKMERARKDGLESFKYNGNTYKRGRTKTGLVFYKKVLE